MFTENFEQWAKMNKNASAPFNEWTKASTEICQRITEKQLEIMGENLSRFSNHLQRLGNIKRPEELITVQKECINEEVSAAIHNTQKLVRIAMEGMEEFTKLCTKTTEAATQNIQKPAKKTEEHIKEHTK